MTKKRPLTADELEALRHRLDAIDDGIVDLIAERQRVVNTIGEHKLKTGVPLRHFAREALAADFRLIWAEVTAYPQKPPAYFLDRGWAIYDARATELFASKVNFPVQTLCVTKALSAFEATMRSA